MKRLLILPLLAFTVLACNQISDLPPLKIEAFTLVAHQPDSLARWYEHYLNLTTSTGNETMISGSNKSQIAIEQAAPTKDTATSQTRKPGFFKIGFATNRLEPLYEQLAADGNAFRGDIFYDQNLQTHSFIALDPEGNRVQFFQDSTVSEITPYFFSFIANEFDKTLAWCQSEMGFEETVNLDLPERGLSIRLLKKDQTLLELIGDDNMEDSLPAEAGISGLTLNRTGSQVGNRLLVFNGVE